MSNQILADLLKSLHQRKLDRPQAPKADHPQQPILPVMPAIDKSIEAFRAGAKDYLNNDKFSDFTIVCEDKEFKVHRCFISVHSKYFERCCDGMFEVSILKSFSKPYQD